MSVSHRTVLQHITLVMLFVGAMLFGIMPRPVHASITITQSDSSGNALGLSTANVLTAGGTLNLYVKVKNDTAGALTIGVSESGTRCSGVSNVIINTSATSINGSGGSKVYNIQILAASTVTTSTCNTIQIQESSASGTVALAFYIGAAPSPTSTPAPTSVSVGGDCSDDIPRSLANGYILNQNEEIEHGICAYGDIDAFRVPLVKDKLYSFEITLSSGSVDLVLELYDPLFRLVAQNDDFYEHSSSSATSIDPQINNYRATMDGIYFLRVREATGMSLGTYTLAFKNLSYTGSGSDESLAPVNSSVCQDVYEPDGLPEQARMILSNLPQRDHRMCPSGDADWVKFFAKQGSIYYIYTDTSTYGSAYINGVLPGADTSMALFDRDGVTVISTNDDLDDTTFDSQIIFTNIPVSGYYFVQIKNNGDIGQPTIKYDVVVEQCAPSMSCGRGNSTVSPTATPIVDDFTDDALPDDGSLDDLYLEETPAPEDILYIPASMRSSDGFVNGPLSQFVDSTFAQLWSRSDRPVARQQASRSWLWGPAAIMARAESYLQASNGLRQVQYFDKGRMEINNPQANRASPWFVTSGLLVNELITGQMQVGNDSFISREASTVPIAGDPSDIVGPTYASFTAHVGQRARNRTGEAVDQRILRDGTLVPFNSNGSTVATISAYVTQTGHNIPDVFYRYLNSTGVVYLNGRTQNGRLMDWMYTMGYPISEAYWTRATVGGSEQWVLVQPFERRVLTYVPSNPVGWQVEQGNVGRHYYRWRYGEELPQ